MTLLKNARSIAPLCCKSEYPRLGNRGYRLTCARHSSEPRLSATKACDGGVPISDWTGARTSWQQIFYWRSEVEQFSPELVNKWLKLTFPGIAEYIFCAVLSSRDLATPGSVVLTSTGAAQMLSSEQI
jgi:hypothetical protein